MRWPDTKTLVTGGASFIGSHLVDALVDCGAAVSVVDNLSSGSRTIERTRMIDAARAVLCHTGHDAPIELHAEMQTGPLNRVAANSLARKLLGWEPKVMFVDGLHDTLEWYFSLKDRDLVASGLSRKLTEW